MFCVGAEPFYLDNLVHKNHPYHQSVFVAHNVEDDTVVADETGITVYGFKFIETGKLMRYQLGISLF